MPEKIKLPPDTAAYIEDFEITGTNTRLGHVQILSGDDVYERSPLEAVYLAKDLLGMAIEALGSGFADDDDLTDRDAKYVQKAIANLSHIK